MTNSVSNSINIKIKKSKESGILNTDDISDGVNTFRDLYELIFHLQEELKKCNERWLFTQ